MNFLNTKSGLTKKILIALLLILSLLLFLRLYHAQQNLGFGHDEDLSAWIVKDIVVEHNPRLIGQETSVGSVFIGPLFYYLEALYYVMFNMDPIGGFYLTLTISVITLFSIYYVFKRFFGKTAALFGSLIYAGSQALAGHDSWIVPTQPTLLWTVWFIYALFLIVETNNRKVFLLLGILLGLIWYVHIAFIPLLILIPLAFFLSKKRLSVKQIFLSKHFFLGSLIFLVLMLPFFVFEIRHKFLQTHGLINSLSEDRHQSENRLFKVYDGVSWSFMNIIYQVEYTNAVYIRVLQTVLSLLFVVMAVFIYKSSGRKIWLIYAWFGIVIFSQLVSKRAISEYYFTNLTVPEILVTTLFLKYLSEKKLIKPVIFLLLGLFVILNLWGTIKKPADPEGYLMRKRLVNFIKQDASSHNYSCIAINYMTSPGKNAGYRYWFWLNNLNLITPANDVPVYSILNPAAMSENEIAGRFGVMGVILPNNPKVDSTACSKPDRQLLPLWGFNN